ncbi:SDR family NAD(P)-dependent oxidoreductase [Mangrovicella endophytica]|uniref:SDR family NAD(P)-dependent oxidoreductase n=1 Tax=Mangrovicella endophytica TaxID=2066697 RepID=UPI000C9E5F98|nr:SDR family NAD(P)-dependent oxidoreductase [Mangrovicella endophytica]
MSSTTRPLAVVTGASTGIGYELARECGENGFDLVIAADEPEIEAAATSLKATGADVVAVQADLSTTAGVDALYESVKSLGRPVEALLANAGRGLGHGFLDQDFTEVHKIVDTNITGTIYLVQKIGRDMRARNKGRILFTGSIAGFIPGAFQAVYNGSKAFINSFGYALRNELKDTEVTVSILMPGATDTPFFERADMEDTSVGTAKKDDPAGVAKDGFKAMMSGEAEVVSGVKNKIITAVANVTPSEILAEQHRKMSEPGSGKS